MRVGVLQLFSLLASQGHVAQYRAYLEMQL